MNGRRLLLGGKARPTIAVRIKLMGAVHFAADQSGNGSMVKNTWIIETGLNDACEAVARAARQIGNRVIRWYWRNA